MLTKLDRLSEGKKILTLWLERKATKIYVQGKHQRKATSRCWVVISSIIEQEVRRSNALKPSSK